MATLIRNFSRLVGLSPPPPPPNSRSEATRAKANELTNIIIARGRGPRRMTSRNRTTPKRHSRNPKTASRRRQARVMTPTTKKAMAKEYRHRRYEKKRAAEREMEGVLRMGATYWRVLRSGSRYRSFGGTRAR